MSREKVEPIEITNAEVDRFKLLHSLLTALHGDVQELAKKKQDVALTKTRIAMINRLLKDVKGLLASQPSAAYLDLLDEDSVAQNADALLITGQYLSAMGRYRTKFTHDNGYITKWVTGQDVD